MTVSNSKSMMQEKLAFLIARCRYEPDLDNQISILRDIIDRLPQDMKVSTPSLITNDYVSVALDRIEEQARAKACSQISSYCANARR